MKKKIPSYLTEKGNIIRLLFFVTFFVFVFIIIFKPFNSNNWKEMSVDTFVFYSILIVVIGLGVLAISRIIMYLTRNRIELYYWTYVAWMLAEIIFISFACTLFVWLIDGRKSDYFQIFSHTIFYSTAILFLPYSILWLYFDLKEKNVALEKIKKSLHLKSVVKVNGEEPNLINFPDDKGNLKLSVNADHLFYIEAADNYIKICYINKEKVSHFILRNSLKNIENLLTNSNLVRCHRSYMVNLAKVNVLRREKDGLYIELDAKSLPDIPVSKTYSNQVIQLFSDASM